MHLLILCKAMRSVKTLPFAMAGRTTVASCQCRRHSESKIPSVRRMSLGKLQTFQDCEVFRSTQEKGLGPNLEFQIVSFLVVFCSSKARKLLPAERFVLSALIHDGVSKFSSLDGRCRDGGDEWVVSYEIYES